MTLASFFYGCVLLHWSGSITAAKRPAPPAA